MATGLTLADYVPAHSAPNGYIENARPPMTRAAWEWLRRVHQRQLVERGALLMIGGRWHVHPAKMEAERVRLAREQTLLRCRESVDKNALPAVKRTPGRPPVAAARRAEAAAAQAVV